MAAASGCGCPERSFAVAVVDDDASFREALAGYISSCGFDVLAFASADAFLDSSASGDAGCLITDMHLPGMNGLDLQRRLRDLGVSLPTIFVTAAPDAGAARTAVAGGALCMLAKPVDEAELLRMIRATVDADPA
jgi:FixJ family two-component response regulator